MVKDNDSFHFTIGPVQGFVAQARRTRDIWAGSYLLSYLAGTAMAAVVGHGKEGEKEGSIVFPKIYADPLFEAIKNPSYVNGEENHPAENAKNHPAARVGSLPNRFKAEALNPGKVATKAHDAMKTAWEKIEKAALTRLKERCEGLITDETEEIWKRQVTFDNLWEIAWVVGDDGVLLDRRKNMRSHFSKEEPGEKCTLCGERQALIKKSNCSRTEVKEWWGEVAEQFNNAPKNKSSDEEQRNHLLQLAEQSKNASKNKGFHFLEKGRERLCAVCTIKRIFPLVAKKAIGWKVHHNYPSTAYMCAIDWLKVVLEKAEAGDEGIRSALKNFINYANLLDVPYDEDATVNQIPWLRDFMSRDENKEWKPILKFRGDVFFPDAINNKNDFPIKMEKARDKTDEERRRIEKIEKEKRAELISKLNALEKAVNIKPTPFYAVLLMDGDNMGKLLSGCSTEQANISGALAAFTSKVDTIVETDHHGKLIYAGGDDVFAFLPLNTALGCAKALKNAYEEAFKTKAPSVWQRKNPDAPPVSISAGIVYAHMNTALRAVIRDAHSLLDDFAKKELGRNAFAVRVWKRGGPILTFGKKWQKNGSDWVCNALALKEALDKGEYSKGFIYRLIELIPILNELCSDEEQIALLTAEYLKSRDKLGLNGSQEQKIKDAKERVGNLLALAMNNKGQVAEAGPLFIRFLAEKEV